ncbi:hypothetical protein [Qipengyuania sp. R86523]
MLVPWDAGVSEEDVVGPGRLVGQRHLERTRDYNLVREGDV